MIILKLLNGLSYTIAGILFVGRDVGDGAVGLEGEVCE